MVALSLSTKLISYVGSGIPIVYHGPRETAAHEVLARNDAAILVTSNDPPEIARAITAGMKRAPELTANALALARREFMLDTQRDRFWGAVARHRDAAPGVRVLTG
jgi:hypothetical protein